MDWEIIVLLFFGAVQAIQAVLWSLDRLGVTGAHARPAKLRKFSTMAALIAITWLALGVDLYHRYFQPDRRIIPASRVSAFEDQLSHSPNPGPNLRIVGLGKSGCALADNYKDILASAGWIITEEQCGPVPTGLVIATQSALHSPVQASDLRRAIQAAHLPAPGWFYDSGLKADQFIFVIGLPNDQ